MVRRPALVIGMLAACSEPRKPLESDGSARRDLMPAFTRPRASAHEPETAPSEEPVCKKAALERFGESRATAAEVRAAIAKASFCAPADWLADALTSCMQRLDEPSVTVRYGVMEGPLATSHACDISVGTADWNGRKWVTFTSDVREGSTYLSYTTAVELSAKGPVLSTDGCQRSPDGGVMGADPPREPPGWRTFPDKLKARLCF
ncbi:MAG: hypothetical protein JNK04_09255 [Myxococcales bacterium]|nr:hypothetical protein [Myxococcales bacterium]